MNSTSIAQLAARTWDWRLDWAALGLGLALIAAIWLTKVADFASDNDPYYALGTGYAVSPADDWLAGMERTAIANCPRDDTKWCPRYQGLIRTDLFFNYPIYASFGRAIGLPSVTPFAAVAAHAALGAMTTGFFVGVALFLVAFAALPPSLRCAFGVIVLAAGPVMMLGQAFAFRQPEIVTSVTWPRLAIYAALVVAMAVLSLLSPLRRIVKVGTQRVASIDPTRLILAGGMGLVLTMAARIFIGGGPLVVLIGIAGFAILFVLAATLADTDRFAAITIGLVLFVIIGPSYFLWPIMPVAARCNIYLAMAPLLAYLALHPNGKLVWQLPALALLHVSVAGLIATALFGVELVACVIRRKPTMLLAVSGVLALIVRVFSNLLFRGFGAGNDIPTVTQAMLASDRLLPAALYSGALALAALALLLRRDPRWDPAGRIILLVAVVAAASQVTPILDLAGFTFFDPGMATLILAPSYLAPAATLGSVLVLLASVAPPAVKPAMPPEHAPARPVILAVTAVALLAVVRVEGHGVSPRAWTTLSTRAIAEIVTGKPDLPDDPPFLSVVADDDRYAVRSQFNVMNDSIIYLSLLKYKVRRAAGAFDAGRATLDNIDGALPENRPRQ